MSTHLADQLAAAAQDAREQMSGVHDARLDPPPEVAASIHEALEHAERCEHLVAVPVQPAYATVTMRPSAPHDLSPTADCHACFTGQTERLTRCSRCARRVRRPRGSSVIEVGHVVVVLLMCLFCDCTMPPVDGGTAR